MTDRISDRQHDRDAREQNARIARHSEIMDLVKHSGLLASEAAQIVDGPGPWCGKCEAHIAGDPAAHVALHVGSAS